MASNDPLAFEWLTAPQPTVLKGQPIIPSPSIAFKPVAFRGFPMVNAAAAPAAFYVSCFLLDRDDYDPNVYADEVRFRVPVKSDIAVSCSPRPRPSYLLVNFCLISLYFPYYC